MFFPLYSLGASFRQIFLNILWPAVLPNFITSLRVAMGTAISVLFLQRHLVLNMAWDIL